MGRRKMWQVRPTRPYIGFMFHVVPEDKISPRLEDPERPPDSNKYK